MGYPFVKQRDGMQCGIACIASVCRHYGMAYPVDFLEDYCQATSEGVSMKGIEDCLDILGFDTRAGMVDAGNLRTLPLPAILHWNQKHFVVLYKISRNGKRYHVSDPGKGNISYTADEFMRHWCQSDDGGKRAGVALFSIPNGRFGNIRAPRRKSGHSLRFLASHARDYRPHFIHIFIGLLVSCILQLIFPFLTQAIVDVGISHRDVGFIWLILTGELLIVAGRTATDFIRSWLLLHISMKINITLLSDFFIKLMRLPMAFFDTKLTGDLLQRMGDHTRIQNFLTGEMLNLMFSLLSFAVFGTVLFIYNRPVFLVFMAGSIIYGLWTILFLKKRKVIDYELFELRAVNQNRTYQFITSAREIKLQDCERRRRWEWEDTQADLFAVELRSQRLFQTQEAGAIFINEIKNILITVFAANAVISGHISLGAMLAIQYIVGQLNSPVSQMMQFIYSLQDVVISLERINDIHLREEERKDSSLLREFTAVKDIRLDNVDFRYDRHLDRKNIEGVSMHIPAGKVTAIVGASGSGKSTLIKLMLGFYPPESGSISIAGTDISRYDVKWWRNQCGVVMQDGVVFSESIERNIAVDDGEVDRERMETAAKIANIHDYVSGLPLGYDTIVGLDGKGLSQGQRQRILIARAVYKNPDYLFLDEATNSLDAKNEREIVERLNEFYRNRTVVVVAHRLSTVRNADRIIVVNEGRIVEAGTHDELAGKKGYYYNLVKNQLELGT